MRKAPPATERNGQAQGLVDNIRDIVALASGLGDDVRNLVEQELLLVKQQVREFITGNIRAAIYLSAAAVVALVGLAMALVTLIEALPEGARPWVALAITILLGAAAAGLAIAGRRSMQTHPGEILGAVREDIEWARQQATLDAK